MTNFTQQVCGYVGSRIYCWCGDTSTNGVLALDPNIYSLDVNSFIGQKTDDLSTKWEKIVPSTPFDTEPRELFNAIVLPDKKRILINGGRTSKKLTNQTIIYDTTTNSWEKSILYADPVRGSRQMYDTYSSFKSILRCNIEFIRTLTIDRPPL